MVFKNLLEVMKIRGMELYFIKKITYIAYDILIFPFKLFDDNIHETSFPGQSSSVTGQLGNMKK